MTDALDRTTLDFDGTSRLWMALTPGKTRGRANAARRIAAGQPVVGGLVGYDSTVLPALENALIAGHDIIFLGERGQGKTRLMRSLVELLDEQLPVVAGSEIWTTPITPSRTTPGNWSPLRVTAARSSGLAVSNVSARSSHARHFDRRPDRRGRPRKGRRGTVPVR